jgi:hypothetical protein
VVSQQSRPAQPPSCALHLYEDWTTVRREADAAVRAADALLIGSYVSQAQEIIDWLATLDRPLFFYDIDTPITVLLRHRHADHPDGSAARWPG